MKVVVTGSNGFIGQKLVQSLLEHGITVAGSKRNIQSLILCDVQEAPDPIEDDRITNHIADISDAQVAITLVGNDADLIFHLAAIVSGQAEQEFELGMRINLDGTRNLLEACRHCAKTPVLVYASSCAVYGGEMPEIIDDSTLPNPQTSYGAQKFAGEILVNDYSRKAFVDGRSLRLPTVTVRPGKPNAAASSFASSIIREPLNGEVAICPVREDTLVWVTSPRTVVSNIIHAAGVTAEQLGMTRSMALPGITVTVGEMLASLERVAGANVRGLVNCTPVPHIEKIVYSWPGRFTTEKADNLGFERDAHFDKIVQDYINDELTDAPPNKTHE